MPSTAATAALVQPSFVPAKAQWWIRNWIEETVNAADRQLRRPKGRAELNVDFCAAIPVLTITGSFGVPVEQALDIREALSRPDGDRRDARADRGRPAGGAAGRPDQRAGRGRDHGRGRRTRTGSPTPRSTRSPCCCWPAGSGTTWKQMGITLDRAAAAPRACWRRCGSDREPAAAGDRGVAALDADRPDVLPLGRPRTSSSTACTFPRARCCTSASVRPTATRPAGTIPTSSTSLRPLQGLASAFGGGPHICLGMHVARAEMTVGIGALLDRLPEPAARPRRRAAAVTSACTSGARPRSPCSSARRAAHD